MFCSEDKVKLPEAKRGWEERKSVHREKTSGRGRGKLFKVGKGMRAEVTASAAPAKRSGRLLPGPYQSKCLRLAEGSSESHNTVTMQQNNYVSK